MPTSSTGQVRRIWPRSIGPGAAVGLTGASLWLSGETAAGHGAGQSEQPVPGWFVPTSVALMVVGALLVAPPLSRIWRGTVSGVRDPSRRWEFACLLGFGGAPIVVALSTTESEYRWMPLVLTCCLPILPLVLRRMDR